jgi:hypothetical protein
MDVAPVLQGEVAVLQGELTVLRCCCRRGRLTDFFGDRAVVRCCDVSAWDLVFVVFLLTVD